MVSVLHGPLLMANGSLGIVPIQLVEYLYSLYCYFWFTGAQISSLDITVFGLLVRALRPFLLALLTLV